MINSKCLRSAIIVGSLILFVIAAAVMAQSSPKPISDELLRTIPAESLFCVRVNNIDHTLGQIDQFLIGASPMPMWLSMMVRGQLTKLLGSPELKGVNMNGSFAIFGAAAAGEPPGPKPSDIFVGVLMPVTDYKQFVDDNSNLSPPDANGVSENTSKEFGGMLIKQIGNYALIGPAESGTFAAIAKSISAAEAKGLAGTLDADELNKAAKEPIWAYGNVQLASKTFGPMLFGKIEEMKIMMESMKAKGQGPMGSPAAIMDMYAGVLEVLMKETKSLSVTVSPKPNVLNIANAISAMPGTEMADMFTADTSAKQNKLLNYLEDGAVMNVSGKITGKLNAKAMDFFATIMTKDINAVEAAELKSFASDIANVFSGNDAMSFSVDPNNKPPFDMKYVIEIEYKDKFNKLIEQGTELFNTGGIADFYKNLGMETSFKLKRGIDNYKGVSIDSAKFVIKSTEPNSPQGKMINAMYGDGFDYRWALVNGLCVAVMGADVDSAIRELIDEVKAGGPKQLASEMKSALTLIPEASKADFVGTYNLWRWFGILGAMMPMPTPFAQMDISTKSNIAFAGKIGQGKMAVEIALPKEHLMEIMGMVQKIQPQSEQAKEISSDANLRQIGISLALYASENEGKFPADWQQLNAFLLNQKLPESPRKPKDFDGPSYIYIAGQTTKMEPGNIIAYENPVFCIDRINVLFLDYHVEAMNPDEFLRKLEATYKRLGREMPDIKFKDSTKK